MSGRVCVRVCRVIWHSAVSLFVEFGKLAVDVRLLRVVGLNDESWPWSSAMRTSMAFASAGDKTVSEKTEVEEEASRVRDLGYAIGGESSIGGSICDLFNILL